MSLKKRIALAAGLLALLLPVFVALPGLSLAGHITLGIFLMAAIFWMFEPIPIFATSVLIIFLQVGVFSTQGPLMRMAKPETLAAQPAGDGMWSLPASALGEGGKVYSIAPKEALSAHEVKNVSETDGRITFKSERVQEDTRFVADAGHWRTGFPETSYTTFFSTLAHPIIILFLGGFLLASAAVKFNLEKNLTRILLKPFGCRPKSILFGLMLVTALLSAFMSNTATTAMMITVVLPIIAQLKPGDKFRTGAALSIPVAANIGGIATPIGTPPNAVAIAALANKGMHIAFSTWMVVAVPIVLLALVFAWRLLLYLFPPDADRVEVKMEGRFDQSFRARVLYVVFALTVVLWVTEKLHGISSSAIAFIPVAILPAFGVIGKEDIRGLSWEVLWLVAGGISLGISLKETGLAAWMIQQVPWDQFGAVGVLAVFALVSILMANFVSHTVTATLLVPLAISLATAGKIDPGSALVITAVVIAIGSSMGMSLPISHAAQRHCHQHRDGRNSPDGEGRDCHGSRRVHRCPRHGPDILARHSLNPRLTLIHS